MNTLYKIIICLVISGTLLFAYFHLRSGRSLPQAITGSSRIEEIHDELREKNNEMIRLGQGALGFPDENSSEEVWVREFLPVCQKHDIPANECQAETLQFRTQWIAKRTAEIASSRLQKRQAEEAAHEKAIAQGYEQNPYMVALGGLLREDYGTGIYLQNYLKQKYIPDIETKSADIKIGESNNVVADFTGSDGSKFTYSLYLGSIERMRKKDFNDIIIWSPVSEKAKQVYTEMTKLPFIDLRTQPKCSAFSSLTKEKALAALKAQGMSFTEYDRQSTEYYFARDGMPDKVDPGERSVKQEKVTVDPCGVSIVIRERQDIKDAKLIFSALIKLVNPALDPIIFDKCVGDKLEEGSRPDHKNPFEFPADCRVIPGLVVAVGACQQVMFDGVVGCHETSLGFTIR